MIQNEYNAKINFEFSDNTNPKYNDWNTLQNSTHTNLKVWGKSMNDMNTKADEIYTKNVEKPVLDFLNDLLKLGMDPT